MKVAFGQMPGLSMGEPAPLYVVFMQDDLKPSGDLPPLVSAVEGGDSVIDRAYRIMDTRYNEAERLAQLVFDQEAVHRPTVFVAIDALADAVDLNELVVWENLVLGICLSLKRGMPEVPYIGRKAISAYNMVKFGIEMVAAEQRALSDSPEDAAHDPVLSELWARVSFIPLPDWTRPLIKERLR